MTPDPGYDPAHEPVSMFAVMYAGPLGAVSRCMVCGGRLTHGDGVKDRHEPTEESDR